MPKKRTPEEQARLDREVADALAVADADRQRRHEQAIGFVTPRHLRSDVARALKCNVTVLQNYQHRKQLELDADTVRDGTEWRLYSSRDVLVTGMAVKLSEVGFKASLLSRVMEQMRPVFSPASPYLASNRPAYVVVLSDGTVIGPAFGDTLDLTAVPKVNFIVIRLDQLIREALEPLGYSITRGTADDMRATAARLEGRILTSDEGSDA